MKVLAAFFFLVAYAYAKDIRLTDQDQIVPIDGVVKDLLDARTFHFHASGNEDVVLVVENVPMQRNAISDAITNLLEDFRDVVENGDPPLDPLHVASVGPLSLSVPAARLTASASDIDVEGLKWYVVNEVTFNPNPLRLTLSMDFTVPRLTVTGQYEGEARLAYIIRYTAGGAFRVFVNRIELSIDMRLGTSILGGHLLLRDLNVVLDIHDTQLFFEGLIGNGWINGVLNVIIQSISQDVIQSQLDNINTVINEVLFEVIDNILRGIGIGVLG